MSSDNTDELVRRWHESDRRSRERRAARRARRSKLRPLVCLVAVFGAAAWVGEGPATPADEPVARAALGDPAPVVKGVSARSQPAFPSAAAMRRAWRFARQRGGRVSIAVVDTRGRLRGRATLDAYPSASVVKAMLLLAELRRLARNRRELDGPTLDRLRAMITESDNDSADAIYARVGDAGLREVATAAHLRRFRVAMSWGYAQVTAGDMARLFARLRRLAPPRYRRTVLELLRSLAPAPLGDRQGGRSRVDGPREGRLARDWQRTPRAPGRLAPPRPPRTLDRGADGRAAFAHLRRAHGARNRRPPLVT